VPGPRTPTGEPGALAALVDALAGRFAAEGLPTELFATHISLVLLAGEYAYKFKKPVDFGFLDFSTLEKRARYCALELALNRRYAPELYIDVLPLCVDAAGPVLGGAGTPVEYAVRMHRFANSERLDEVLARGALADSDLVAIARLLAAAHARAPGAPATAHFGTPPLVRRQLLDGLAVLADVVPDHATLLRQLEARCGEQVGAFEARLQRGHVRDCHGDLHLSNLVRWRGRWLPFDCIEFSDELRWIDTASDLAFLLMDLDLRGASAAANRLANEYLTASGDFGALSVLDFYCLYRSMVRAKVARLASTGEDDQRRRARAHVALARRYLERPRAPALLITHGVAGSGKSWLAARIAAARGYVHLRSDHERRRLAGLELGAPSRSGLAGGLYAAERSAETYARLAALADGALRAGHSVIVDATFLDAGNRAALRAVAEERGCPFAILDCDAPPAVLRERVATRQRAGNDPSEATLEVLERQLRVRQALTAAERAVARPAVAADDAFIAALPGTDRLPAA
jgi:aminoglycoside phosphotransferase family enzyme/predicted kinase